MGVSPDPLGVRSSNQNGKPNSTIYSWKQKGR